MRPKPDAHTYYKTKTNIDKRIHAQIKVAQAREALKDKLGLGEVNRYEKQSKANDR